MLQVKTGRFRRSSTLFRVSRRLGAPGRRPTSLPCRVTSEVSCIPVESPLFSSRGIRTVAVVRSCLAAAKLTVLVGVALT